MLGSTTKSAAQGRDDLVNRMLRVAKLDVATFEEIEADVTATQQALTVVVLAAIASGIGAIESDGVAGLVMAPVGAVLGWLLFCYVAWFVGTKWLPGKETEATVGELRRTVGFAQVPGLLAVFGVVPLLGGLLGFVGAIWGLITAIIALRVALEVSTGRAIAIGLIAAIISGLAIALLFLPFGLAALALA
jgi:hypothetical protein